MAATDRTVDVSSDAASSDDQPFRSEQLVLCRDDESGLRAAIAIDDTTLGPGLGGVRLKRYPSERAAIVEAQRLAAAMTLKNAAAGLPYGGGKSVILDDGAGSLTGAEREGLMRAFGRFVARLDGRYLPGVDMGTTTDDLAAMGAAGAAVSCSSEDPSPWTALGVRAAIRAAVEHVDGREDLDGIRVLVQGAGHVGAALARHVAGDGATVLVADVDHERARALAAELGGEAVPADAVIGTPCDVYAPCAVARVISATNAARLDCRIVAGAANDTLAARADADRLAERGIVYVPDFVANAGGVVHIHALRAGWDADGLRSAVEAIGGRVSGILADADALGSTPLVAAEAGALARIAEARERRRGAGIPEAGTELLA
jgi:leucine dehydrogenase